MADRFWVGGSGSWGDTSSWSTTSGGAGGASVPSTSDDVYFDANSSVGSFLVLLGTAARSSNNFTVSGLSGIMTLSGTAILSVTGTVFSLPATNLSITMSGQITLSGSAKTVDFNGNVITNGQVQFNSDCTLLSAVTSTFQVSIRSGLLNLNGYTLTCRNLLLALSGARSITYGAGGQIVLTGSGLPVLDLSLVNLTFNDPANGGITLTSTASGNRTLSLGTGLSVGELSIGGATGTGSTIIQGSATFTAISSTKTVAHNILFTDGTTQTVGEWRVRGTSGKLITLTGTGAAGWSIALSGGDQVNADFLAIQYSTATPAESWFAGDNSTDSGSNTGWIFTESPDSFLMFFPAAGA